MKGFQLFAISLSIITGVVVGLSTPLPEKSYIDKAIPDKILLKESNFINELSYLYNSGQWDKINASIEDYRSITETDLRAKVGIIELSPLSEAISRPQNSTELLASSGMGTFDKGIDEGYWFWSKEDLQNQSVFRAGIKITDVPESLSLEDFYGEVQMENKNGDVITIEMDMYYFSRENNIIVAAQYLDPTLRKVGTRNFTENEIDSFEVEKIRMLIRTPIDIKSQFNTEVYLSGQLLPLDVVDLAGNVSHSNIIGPAGDINPKDSDLKLPPLFEYIGNTKDFGLCVFTYLRNNPMVNSRDFYSSSIKLKNMSPYPYKEGESEKFIDSLEENNLFYKQEIGKFTPIFPNETCSNVDYP